MKRRNSHAVMIEQRLDFSRWVPEGFGTGDLVIVADDTLYIVDLKYGKGIAVSAEWNPQMLLYSLGALELFDSLYDIEKVNMTIHQPRLENVSNFEITVHDLMEWAEQELMPKAEMAAKGEGEFAVGDWCRFCKAKNTCRARAEKYLRLARMEFKPPELLSEEEIAEVLKVADELAKACKGIRIDDAELQGLNITEQTVIEEVVKNGKKHYCYTSKADFDCGIRNSTVSAEIEDGSVLPSVNRPRRTVIKL